MISLKTPVGEVTCTYGTLVNKNVILVLDRSGSMSGSRMTKAKNVISQLAAKVELNRMVVFDTTAQLWSLNSVETVIAGGGTYFQNAFGLTKDQFCRGLNIIVLITDGETTAQDVNGSIAILEGAINEGTQVQVHSLGIHADKTLLLKLSQLGSFGTVLNIERELDTAEQMRETTDTLAALINSADRFAIVDGLRAEAEQVELEELDAYDPDLPEHVMQALIQRSTKKNTVDGMISDCDNLLKMLSEMKLDHEVRGRLHNQIRDLRALAVRGIRYQSEFDENVSKICFAQKRRKLDDLTNKRILNNASQQTTPVSPFNDPFVFPENLMNARNCSITAMDPWMAYGVEEDRSGDIYGITLNWRYNDTWTAEPENMVVQVQNEFLVYKGGYQAAVNFFKDDPSTRTFGVIRNMDGLVVKGFCPVIANGSGWWVLEQCAALVSAGDIRAVATRATRALPFAVLINLYTRDDWTAQWINDIRQLVTPMAHFALPKHFARFVESFGLETCRTPDVVPSLSMFLMRCIVSGDVPITDELMYKIFTEDCRRRRKDVDQAWEMKQLWKSHVELLPGLEEYDLVTQVREMWLSGTFREYKPIKKAQVVTVPDESAIDELIKTIQLKWSNSVLKRIADRYASENGVDLNDSSSKLSTMTIQEKLAFLAATKLNSAEVKVKKAPVTSAQHDKDCVDEVFIMNSSSLWTTFEWTKSIEEAAAVAALLSEQEWAYFRRTLRSRPDVTLSAIKANLDPRYFVIKVDNKFVHVTNKPGKSALIDALV